MGKNKYIKKIKKYIKKLNNSEYIKKFIKIYKNLKSKFSKFGKKGYLTVFLILSFIFLNKFCFIFRISPVEGILSKINYAMDNIHLIFTKGGIISLNKSDISLSILIFFICVLLFSSRKKRKLKNGIEYGSACWGNINDSKNFIDDKFENNILFSETERMTLFKPKDIKFARNKNIVVIGGSGSGKTRFFVKPNLMQMHSSYVVTDPKGTLVLECGQMLKDNGYNIKIFNTIDFEKSMHYNPFNYIRKEEDIITFVDTLISNTQGENQNVDFWVNAEKMYYTALVGYIWYECEDEEKNMETLLLLVDNSKIGEDVEDKNVVDLLMEDLEQKDPYNFAVRQYKKYRNGAKETLQSILVSCGVRLSPFDTKAIRELTAYDDLNLESLGDEKTALFIILSDTNPTFNFIISIMYTQLFNILCEKADIKHNGRLPIHVRFLLDEFANIGKIPNFEKLIATIRSREISACPILQTKSQLKSLYKDGKDETIIGNCDTMIFLGGGEKSTLKDVSELLGKETIDFITTSDTKGSSPSFGTNFQKTGRELLTESELATMDNNKCIVQIRGVPPFLSNKFDITKHKQYEKLADYNDKNLFNVEKYLKDVDNNKLQLNENDVIVLSVDIDNIDDNIIKE